MRILAPDIAMAVMIVVRIVHEAGVSDTAGCLFDTRLGPVNRGATNCPQQDYQRHDDKPFHLYHPLYHNGNHDLG